MHLVRIATFQKIQGELSSNPYEVAKISNVGVTSEEATENITPALSYIEDSTPKITGRQALIKKLTGKRIRPAIIPESYKKKQKELNLAQTLPGNVSIEELFEKGGTGWDLKDRHKQSLKRYRAAVKEAKVSDKETAASHRLEALEPVSVKELKKRDKVVVQDEIAPTI